MSTPIFDRIGRTVGWLDGEVVRLPNGQHIAFVSNNGVHDYGGRCIGYFEDGYFRDSSGNAVAFVQGATGGPLPPLPQLPPLPPLFPLAPIAPIPSIPPIPPIFTLHWSALSWDQFLTGDF
jgi:hypothetical protein